MRECSECGKAMEEDYQYICKECWDSLDEEEKRKIRDGEDEHIGY